MFESPRSPFAWQARPRPVRPVPAAVSISPVTSSPSPLTSPPSYITSRDEALKETSLTEACNSVILRARPARVRSPADGGRDSESDGDTGDAGDAGGDAEEICLPQPPPGQSRRGGHIVDKEMRHFGSSLRRFIGVFFSLL